MIRPVMNLGNKTTDVCIGSTLQMRKVKFKVTNISVKFTNSKALLSQISESVLQKGPAGKNETKGLHLWGQWGEFGFKELGHLRRGWDGPLRNCLCFGASPGTNSRCFIFKLKAISGRTSVQSCVDFVFYPLLWIFFFFLVWLSMQTTFMQAVDHLWHRVWISTPFPFITSLGKP